MNTKLKEIIDNIEKNGGLYEDTIKEAQARQEVLAKPTGALGTLEDISIQLAGITGKVKNSMKHQAGV